MLAMSVEQSTQDLQNKLTNSNLGGNLVENRMSQGIRTKNITERGRRNEYGGRDNSCTSQDRDRWGEPIENLCDIHGTERM